MGLTMALGLSCSWRRALRCTSVILVLGLVYLLVMSTQAWAAEDEHVHTIYDYAKLAATGIILFSGAGAVLLRPWRERGKRIEALEASRDRHAAALGLRADDKPLRGRVEALEEGKDDITKAAEKIERAVEVLRGAGDDS